MGLTDVVAPFDDGQRDFRDLSPRLWRPLGQALVDHAQPTAGERVLDACCGDGASAIPAAYAVGARGHVDAVDGAGVLLDAARHAITEQPQLSHQNLRFTQADVTTLTADDSPYDLVQCAYGVFFFPDMDAGSRHLIGLLKPGGRFAVSAWRHPALREFATCLIDSVSEIRGAPVERPTAIQPAERIDDTTKLGDWLRSLGLTDVRTTDVPFTLDLDEDLAWKMVLGTGFRRFLAPFDATDTERVRVGTLRRIADRGLTTLDASSVVGLGHTSTADR